MSNRHSPDVMKLTTEQLRDIVDQIRDILWFDFAEERYDPDKE